MPKSIPVILRSLKSNFRFSAINSNEPNGRDRERYRRILLGGISSLVAKATALLALAITTPLTLNYLGSERFGVWMTLSSLVVVLGFADFGIGNGLLNLVAEAHGRDDLHGARAAVTTSVVLLGFAGAMLVVVTFAVYPFVHWQSVYNLSSPFLATECGRATGVLLLCLAVTLPLATVQRVQLGYQEGMQANVWQSANSVAMLLLIIPAVALRARMEWLVAAVAGGPAIVMLINYIHQFAVVRPWLSPKLCFFDWKLGRKIIRLGGLWTWFQLMTFVGTGADNLVIAHLLGAASVGRYAVMSKLLSVLMIAPLFSAPLWAAFAEAFERGDLGWVRRTFARTLTVFSLCGLLGAMVLTLGSSAIVRTWVGPTMQPNLTLILGFAVWCFVTNLFGALAVLLANNRLLKKLVYITTIAAVVAFVLKLLLAAKLGVGGIVWASAVGYALACIPGLAVARQALRPDAAADHLR